MVKLPCRTLALALFLSLCLCPMASGLFLPRLPRVGARKLMRRGLRMVKPEEKKNAGSCISNAELERIRQRETRGETSERRRRFGMSIFQFWSPEAAGGGSSSSKMIPDLPSLSRTFTVKVVVAAIGTLFASAGILSSLEGIRYIDALYWTVTVCTTAGYGDLVPTNVWSRIVVSILSFAGLGLIGTLASDVVSEFAEQRGRVAASPMQVFGTRPGAIWGHSHQAAASQSWLRTMRRLKSSKEHPWRHALKSLFKILFVGTVGLKLMEGDVLSWGHALYLSMSAASTVGLGDIVATTSTGRNFLCVYGILGTFAFSRLVGSFALGPLEHERQRVREKLLENFRTGMTPALMRELTHGKRVKALGLCTEDDSISRNEFILLLLVQQGKISEQDLRACRDSFDLMDIDGSGTLTEKDLQLFPESIKAAMEL